MTRRELADLCLQLPDSYEDYPFDDENWMVIRHRTGNRIFAWIYEREGHLCVNLKCEPMQADFWRSVYTGVTPGFHMNKTHWNTLRLPCDVPLPELTGMIYDSHTLTRRKPNTTKRKGEP